MHLVVTGLTLRAPLYKPLFLFHAIRSHAQAAAHPGIRHLDQRSIGGVHHTLTLWEDAAAARDYGTCGAHHRAAAVYAKIATGKIYAGRADTAPDWPTARRLWDEQGRVV